MSSVKPFNRQLADLAWSDDHPSLKACPVNSIRVAALFYEFEMLLMCLEDQVDGKLWRRVLDAV